MDGEWDTCEGVQHPDCKWLVVGQGDIDRETFNAMTRSGLLAAEKRSLEIISMTAEGDRVAYEAKGELVFPDRVYSNSYHNLLVIRAGLTVPGRDYIDTMALPQAFRCLFHPPERRPAPRREGHNSTTT